MALRNIALIFFFSFSALHISAQNESEETRQDKKAQDKINERVHELLERQGKTIDEDASPPMNQSNDTHPFKNLDSSMTRSFGYFFDGNTGKMWNGKDTVPAQGGMQDMQEQMRKMMPDMEKLFGGMMPGNGMQGFGGMDSMMQKSFGFLFDGKNMTPFGSGDSMQRKQLEKLFGNMDFGKLMEGNPFQNFDFGTDKMPRVKPEDNSKTKKDGAKKEKYTTEGL